MVCCCCCCCARKLKPSEPFLRITPYKQRHCTDVFFYFLFIIFWAVIVYLARLAMLNGNYNHIVRGMDMDAKVCGFSTGVTDQQYAAWPAPEVYDIKVCVSSCDDTTTDPRMIVNYKSRAFLYYCIPTEIIVDPTDNTTIDFDTSSFNTFAERGSRGVGDVYTSARVIGGCVAAALLLSFLSMYIIRWMAGGIVWFMISFIGGGAGVAGWLLLTRSKDANDTTNFPLVASSQTALAMQIFAYVLFAVSGLFILIVIGIRKRIRLAIGLLKEAARAFTAMPSISFFPLYPFIIASGYFVFWIIVALCLYSVGDLKANDTPSIFSTNLVTNAPTGLPTTYYTKTWDSLYQKYFAFHFFSLLWNVQFLIYFSFAVISGAVADWYFTPRNAEIYNHLKNQVQQQAMADGSSKASNAWGNDENGDNDEDAPVKKQLSKWPVASSCKRVCRFHIGTVALASLIVSIVDFIRMIVRYLEASTSNKTNRLAKCIFCLVNCCLKCIRDCLDTITKQGLVWNAIWGDNFCRSGASSLNLLIQNPARLVAITFVEVLILFFLKILVAVSCTAVCAGVLTKISPYDTTVYSIVVPCALVFGLSYFVASIFLVMYETAVDTVFMCFLVDETTNKNSIMLASKELREIVDNCEKGFNKIEQVVPKDLPEDNKH